MEASLQMMMFTLKISFQDKQPEFFLQQRCESGDEGVKEVAKLSVCVWLSACSGDGEDYGMTGWPS